MEADNYIRDKTFKEDDVKMKYGNQAQLTGRLRGLAMALIRSAETKNLQKMIDKFMDCPDSLVAVLKQENFLWESRWVEGSNPASQGDSTGQAAT